MKSVIGLLIRWSGILMFVCLGVVSDTQAQVRFGAQAREFDRVRLAASWWDGSLDGRITPRLDELPSDIDIGDLVLVNTEGGWFGEVDFGLAKRHRLRLAGSDRLSGSMTTVQVGIDVIGISLPIDVPVSSEMGLREFQANYNFLFVANSAVDAGILAGIGYFDATARLSTPVGDADGALDSPFPSLGSNLLLNPLGRFRGYVELTGFPEITIDDFSGWQMGFLVRAEAFITQNIGLYAGYRTYELDFEDESVGLAVDLLWKGFVVGGAVRF